MLGPMPTPPSDRQAIKRIEWTGIVLLLLLGTTAAIWYKVHRLGEPLVRPDGKPSFELLALQPEGVILRAGTRKPLPIRIERKDGFQEAVKVEALKEVAGLKVDATVIAPESDKGEVRLDAVADAVPGLCRVNLRATANGQPEKLTSLQVVILPFGFEPEGGIGVIDDDVCDPADAAVAPDLAQQVVVAPVAPQRLPYTRASRIFTSSSG
jgi:hypothetical protein